MAESCHRGWVMLSASAPRVNAFSLSDRIAQFSTISPEGMSVESPEESARAKEMARLNILQSAAPSIVPAWTPTPMILRLGAQQKLSRSASEKCPRPGTRFRNQFEIVRHYPAKKITLIPRRAARAVKGARRAFISTLDSPSRPIESQRERSETKFSEASFPC